MNSIVEQLHDPFHMHDSKVMHEAADLIESQERRIKELEAALESRKSTNAGWNAYYALRKRIEDAPVVAWQGNCAELGHWCLSRERGGLLNATKLISKEDLQE